MSVSPGITKELEILLFSFAAGAALVTVYDILRICRRVVVHPAVFVVVQDIIYWIFCAVTVAGVYYEINDGIIRGFALGGMAAGMLLDNQFISPIIVTVCCFILNKIIGILRKPCRFLKKLLKKLWKLFKMSLYHK